MADTKKEKDFIAKVYEDLDYSARAYSKLFKEIKDDFKFAQGEQWDPMDVQELRKAGVKALTINKIKPIIKLITGIERQSRSDFKAFPEGGEDVITAEVASKLMKNIVKISKVERKHSEQFKHGCIGGVSYIEPYMDYTYDLINGVMRFKKLSALDVFPDPDAQEYDLSDGKFQIKVTRDLTRDELVELFPDKEKDIDSMTHSNINWENVRSIVSVIENDMDHEPHIDQKAETERGTYDLIDYYYKKLTKTYFVAVQETGQIEEIQDKDTAEQLAQQVGGVIIAKMVPVIRHAQVVGAKKLYDDVAWFYPRWKRFSILPYFAEEITEKLGDKSVSIQGIVRSIKDLNEEFNKRRTQELRHLNASANSGFDIEKGQLDDQNMRKIKKYGSSPGIVIERKPGTAPISRIVPMPLSQGHVQLAEENMQDLKEASGVNPDLLATDSKSQSGRAILLKQRQGLVMIQEMLDNFGETKRLTGQFILSQLKEVFTVEAALKVLGDAWVSDNFTVPVNIVLERGLQKVANEEQPTELEQSVLLQYPQQPSDQPILDESGNLETIVDSDTAIQVVNQVLNDAEIGKYDVAIGEGPYSETIRMANFLDLKELAQQGVPIPPDVLIEMSLIPESQKKSVLESLRAQALAAQQAQQGGQQ
jgi:hypothetical protein